MWAFDVSAHIDGDNDHYTRLLCVLFKEREKESNNFFVDN